MPDDDDTDEPGEEREAFIRTSAVTSIFWRDNVRRYLLSDCT